MDRAEARTTLVYRFFPTLTAGVEWNPAADDIGLVANWVAVTETEVRPALILGTSSDRIGTLDGRAVYATLSKSLEPWTGLPVAPYAGVSYGGSDDELRGIGGLSIAWSERVSSLHTFDGKNLHHQAEYAFPNGMAAGLMLAELDDHYFLGFTFNVGFSMPWEAGREAGDD